MSAASEAILALLDKRDAGATICPSEAARILTDGNDGWREGMPDIHRATDRLLERGEIELSWKGRKLAARDGPYRIAKAER